MSTKEKPSYKIVASTLEDFQKIEERILGLPAEVLSQVEKAEAGVCGVHCTFRKDYRSEIKIALPENTTQISDFDDHIGCYAGRFHFIVPKYEKVKITYYFTNRSVSKRDALIKSIKDEVKQLNPSGVLPADLTNATNEQVMASRLYELIAQIEKI